MKITSTSPDFSGIILNNGAYKITDSTFSFLSSSDGSDVSDFTGRGSVLAVFGDATKLVADHITIRTSGVAKAALVNDKGADVLITNSTLESHGGTLYSGYRNTANQSVMVAPPWVLGLSGTARTTNLIGTNTTSTFVNCTLSADGWGVLSTDACSNVVLTAIDSSIILNSDPDKNGGYGAYAIGNAKEDFRGCRFDASTYAVIVAGGGNVTLGNSDGTYDIINQQGEKVFSGISGKKQQSTVDSKSFGFLVHSQGGTLNLGEGTTVHTKDAVFLVKSAGAEINIRNASVSADNGILLQLMDDDDCVVGMADGQRQIFNSEYNEKSGFPGIDYTPEVIKQDMPPMPSNQGTAQTSEKGQPPKENPPSGFDMGKRLDNVALSLTDAVAAGNIYNSTGYTGEGYPLTVTLGANAVLTGAVCSSSANHSTDNGKTQNTHFTSAEFWKLGHVVNRPFTNGKNKISVVLAGNAEWNVSGKSIINELLVQNGAVLNGAVYIDGIKTQVKPAVRYTGSIIVVPAGTSL